MEKKNLQERMREKQLEIKTPLELFKFVDEYFRLMDNESKMALLCEVYGVHLLPISDEEMSLSEYKFHLGHILKYSFRKEKRDPRPIVLFISLGTPPKWLLDPLERRTTPEQLEYLTWLVYAADLGLSKGGIDVNEIPEHIRMYLRG